MRWLVVVWVFILKFLGFFLEVVGGFGMVLRFICEKKIFFLFYFF